MTTKHTLKIVQLGQTHKIHVIHPGAGLQGQALIIQAVSARYQLTDIVTQTSPRKLQTQRIDKDLHIALPGGDVQAPDVIIQNYFEVQGASLWGVSAAGEWMGYDTSSLQNSSAAVSDKATTLTLATPSTPWLSVFDSSWGLAGLGAGAAVIAAASGGGSDTPVITNTSAEEILKNYATATHNTAPTLANYTSYGIKSYSSLNDTSEGSRVALNANNTDISAINNAIAKLGNPNINKETVQKAVDAYFRILKEADGNSTTDADVYADTTHDAINAAAYDDPTADDYAAVGATIGHTTQALSLLNDVVGRSAASLVDTVDDINALARAAENIMLQAKAASGGATGGPAIYTDDEWLTGLALIGITGVTSVSLLADVKAAIAASADDGSAVDTVHKLQAALAPVLALQTLKTFTDDSAAIGSKTAPIPTLSTYKDLGVQAWTSLTDTTRVALDDAAVGSLLNATMLNSYLDAQTGSSLSKDRVQILVDGLYRILKEADGNSNNDLDIYPLDPSQEDPSLADYAAVGLPFTDISSGTTGNETLNLLNDAVGRLTTADVDSHSKLQTLQVTAQDVMRLAAGQTTIQTDTDLLSGLKTLSGLNALNNTQRALVKETIAASTDDGSAIDTVQELQTVMQKAMALQILKNYSVSSSNTAPTLTDYQNAGLKAYDNLITENLSTDIGGGSATWLTASALNSALDAHELNNFNTAVDIQNAVQPLINAYYRILSEADGVINTTTNTDVYPNTTAQNDPQRSDYSAIGATVGSDAALALLNDLVGLSARSAIDTVGEINAFAQAAENVMVQAGVAAGSAPPPSYNNTEQWITGLNLLLSLSTATGVNANNLDDVKTTLATVNGNGANVDTVQEIKDLLAPVFALHILKDYTNANGVGVTIPNLSHYTQAGIKTFKSLSDTSDANRKTLGNASTTSGAEDNTFLSIIALNNALDRLDGTALTKAQVQAMADAYYRILRETDGSSDNDLDIYPLDPSQEDPSLADYAAIGLSLTGISSGTTSNEALNLLNDAVGRLTTSAVDTTAELQTLATTANDVMRLAQGQSANQNDTQLINGLNALLDLNTNSGVNNDNLLAFITILNTKDDNGQETDTVSELQSLLSLIRLKDFTNDSGALDSKTAPTPTLADWSAIGLTANTSIGNAVRVSLSSASYWSNTNPTNGLTALNSALDALPGDQVNLSNLQKLVDAYGRIMQYADSAWTTATDVANIGTGGPDVVKQDLIDVGITSFTLASGDLLASTIGNLTTTSLDSLAELQTLSTTAENIMKQSTGQPVSLTDAEWVSALNNFLRLSTGNGVTSSNIGNILATIAGTSDDGTGVDTYNELQAIVSSQRLHDYAASSTGSPQLLDYQMVYAAENAGNYTMVKASGIAAYNSAVQVDTNITSGEITTLVDLYNNVLNNADGNRANTVPTLTVENYQTLGVQVSAYIHPSNATAIAQSHTLALLNDVISGLTADGVDSVPELQDLEDIIGKIMTMAANVKTSGVNTSDYTAPVTQAELGLLGLRITGTSELVSGSNVSDVETLKFNELVIYSADNGSEVNSFLELQGLLNSAILLA